MKLTLTPIKDLVIIEPKVFGDERGYFYEAYNKNTFHELGLDYDFVQDNQSFSRKGVLRGLHFQKNYPQAKLVRCVLGSIFDVAVDIRKSSPTYGQWVGFELSAENKRQLWIPEGFAHGFVALTDFAEVCYKTNEYWHKECEGSIRWDDPTIGIVWPMESQPCLSEKDALAPYFKDAITFE